MKSYVTLFDSAFLAQGLCLQRSLMERCPGSELWICGVDRPVVEQLESLHLQHTHVFPLEYVERMAPRLPSVKPGRTAREYCWTLTPFVPEAVFRLRSEIAEVTYLDADLFFFASPSQIDEELSAAGKDVLITGHAYDPVYDQTARSGRFCVQYLTFRQTEGGLRVLRWWQERVLEWCFARFEDGKMGDQMYLDSWPILFANEVHVLGDTARALAPWNVSFFEERDGGIRPVFYHFHGLRIETQRRVRLFERMYRMRNGGMALYAQYLEAIREGRDLLRRHGIPLRTSPNAESWRALRFAKRLVTGTFPPYARL